MTNNQTNPYYEVNLAEAKLSLIRVLISPKRSQLSYYIRFWSGVLMFFSILLGSVILLFLITTKNPEKISVILGFGLFFICFGFFEAFFVTLLNIIMFNISVRKKIKNDSVIIYERLFNDYTDIELKNINKYEWDIKLNNKTYHLIFDSKYENFSITQGEFMHWYKNDKSVLLYKYHFIYKYLFMNTSSFYQTIVLSTINNMTYIFLNSYFEIKERINYLEHYAA